MNGPLPKSWSPHLLSVFRIVAGFLFAAHGTQKLFAFPVAEPRATAELLSRMGAAGLIEVVGGTLLILGLFTRPVAFLAAGEMAFAYFLVHASRGFWPTLNGGELAALYCFAFLYLAAAGGGAWSLDARLARWRGEATAAPSPAVHPYRSPSGTRTREPLVGTREGTDRGERAEPEGTERRRRERDPAHHG